MNIVINEELKAYIDPLTPEEYAALERSLLAEGCRDALVLWGDVLVDGHNRYDICQKHGLPFQVVQSTLFQSMDDVRLWMIDQHLGRRSVSDFQRGVLALRKRDLLAQQRARFLAASAQRAAPEADPAPELAPEGGAAHDDGVPWDDGPSHVVSPVQVAVSAAQPPLKNRDDVARAARLRSSQVSLIEKIHAQAVPEVVQAVKTGVLSLPAAAAVATLPEDEQRAAAQAGPAELKGAAKRVRESKRKPKATTPVGDAANAGAEGGAPGGEVVEALERRVAELEAENAALRKQVANLLAQLVG